MRGVEVFLPLDDDSKCKSDSKAARGQIKLDVLAEEAKYGRSLCENQPHIQRRSKLRFSFFFFHSGRNCAWWFIEPLCITSFLHFRSLFNWRPANKTRRYSPPLRPLNLTAQSAKRFEYKTTTKKKQASSLVFFPFSSLPVLLIAHSSFLLSTCLSCCGLVWILWIPSPLQCIRLETPQMPALGKLQKKQKKTRESDGMKMSVMANKTLSHSYNISVTDYQTGDSKAHTFRHTQTTGG